MEDREEIIGDCRAVMEALADCGFIDTEMEAFSDEMERGGTIGQILVIELDETDSGVFDEVIGGPVLFSKIQRDTADMQSVKTAVISAVCIFASFAGSSQCFGLLSKKIQIVGEDRSNIFRTPVFFTVR